ncbi:MAG: hypothetical protein M1822_001265 [Bathelium mastoideum]|nr:MAG: hypothetical protein M1822_001265 [Bathelium mastoideum]
MAVQYKRPPPHTTLPSERQDDAPGLNIFLSTSPILSLSGGKHQVTVTLSYTFSSTNRPITFKDPILDWKLDGLTFSLFHKSPECLSYIANRDGHQGPTPYTEPEGTVSVAKDRNFVTLKPGESLTKNINLYPEPQFEGDFKVGQTYAYRFNGGELEWWTWGNEQASTVDLKDLEVPVEQIWGEQSGPKVIVPASEFVELSVKE